MSEFVVEVRLPRELWHRLRPLCARLGKPPEVVGRELVRQFVRDGGKPARQARRRS